MKTLNNRFKSYIGLSLLSTALNLAPLSSANAETLLSYTLPGFLRGHSLGSPTL